MKIYLDLVLLINFFLDFIILYGTKVILKETTRFYRIVLGSITGSVSIVLLFIELNNFILFIVKLLISIMIIIVTFGRRNFFKNIIYFYLISIVLGGSLYLLDITYVYKNKGLIFFNNGLSLNMVLIILISPIIIFIYVKEHKQYKNNYSDVYMTEIIIKDKVYRLKSILDTGNKLKDPYTKKDIILVNNTVKIDFDKCIYVPYIALNTKGLIKCIKPDKVIVNDKIINRCLIGLSKDNFNLDDIDCILPNKIREDI